MENEPELIRDQMQETRTALTEKLDTLQQKVADTVDSITTPVAETVQTVKEAVSDTVDSVKETVSDTVETVKETFNLSRQVEQHPWPMMLGSLATGFVLGRLLPSPFDLGQSSAAASDQVAAGMTAAAQGHNGYHPVTQRAEEAETPRPEEKGLFSGLAEAFGSELDQLKGLAVGVGVGLLRDLATQSLQGELGGRIKEWMDGLTRSLGGKPFEEPLVAPVSDGEAAQEKTEKASTDKGDPKKSPSRKAQTHQKTTPRW